MKRFEKIFLPQDFRCRQKLTWFLSAFYTAFIDYQAKPAYNHNSNYGEVW